MSGHPEHKLFQTLVAIEEEEFKRAAAAARGKLVCWITINQPVHALLQETLDISVFDVTIHGRFAAFHGVAQKFIEAAEAAGYSQEICSYYKVAIGYGLFLARGQLDTMPELPVMPRPDLMWATNGCAHGLQVAEALGCIFDIPVIGIDTPFNYDVRNRESRLDYVRGQLREAMDFLETLTGRPVDWPRLEDSIRDLVEVADVRNALDQAHRSCPSGCTCFDIMPPKWAHKGRRFEQAKSLYGEVKEKIQKEKERIERGERDISDEIRLTFIGGAFPWLKLDALTEVLARHGAVLCTAHASVPHAVERGEGLDPGNALGTVAYLHLSDYRNETLDNYIEGWIGRGIEGYNIDGVILHEQRTCKNLGVGQQVEAAELEEKYGVSTFILESDPLDMAFFSQTQVEDRLGSWLDGIARRKAETRRAALQEK